MKDLFEREQKIYEEAVSYMKEVSDGDCCSSEHYEQLVAEYGRLLKQLRRFTKISDRMTIDLNASKLALLDKVNCDGLTGIFNRRFMEEKMAQMIAEAAGRDNAWLSVLMIDIDFFKRFNDTYGHHEGDKCLRMVAHSLKETIAGTDGFVARYGGEEFIVVLPDTTRHEADQMAERLLANVRDCKIFHEKNEPLKYVTISIGGTAEKIKALPSAEEFIKRADQALYKSKQRGRNRYTPF